MGKKSDLESVHLVNHSKCMLAAFQNFRQDETMLDVTLVCNGMSLKAHKLVLSACSPLFKEILSDNPCAHPVIILRSFEFADLKAVIEFIYKGELSVPRERLMIALKVAEELQIRGLHRSAPSTEKYEKLYNQVRGKSSHKKKRKRLRRNSSDSEENECVSIPDSDHHISESDEASSVNEETRTESLEAMEVDSARLQESTEVDKLVRPVVLRVGDPVTNNEESIPRNLNEDEGSNIVSSVEMKTVSDRDSQNECSASLIDNVKDQAYESISENVATTSKFNAYAASSDVLPDYIDVDDQINAQDDSLPATEYSEEQDGLISSSCLSPKSTETQQIEEVRFKDEGKSLQAKMGKKSDLESVHLVNHSKCMLAAFQNFRQDETMLDVTLVCNGMSLKAHKLVLSACSPLFKEILSDNPCAHPVIILRSFEFADLKAVIEFIYKGELSVPRERLMIALKVAEELQIRGLHRSAPSTEKYEKLYNQVRGKSSHKKKRKRLRRNSSDSEENECVSIPDSDHHISESDEASSVNEETRTESLEAMEVDSARLQESTEVDKLVRPVVLRVGDPVTNNEESIPRNLNEDEGSNIVSSVEMKTVSDRDSQNECSASLIDNVKDQAYESISENVATTSKFNAYAASSDVLPDYIDVDDQINAQDDSLPATEYSEEQDGLISSSCLSPKSTETQQIEEVRFKDEGKRFICSKCDSVFTSRINFMRHKSMGHNNLDKKRVYECKQCDFTSEDLDCYKEHLQLHSDKVPYKCSSCPEEFTSEDLYKQHLLLHKEEDIALFSSVQDFFPNEKISPEKVLEFRCSICFQKFKSKLSCQIHEKSCQGGN